MIATKSLIQNISATLVFKFGALVVVMLTIPNYISYFEDQSSLGLWFAILAILNWIMFFDIGLGNGIRNKVILAIADGRYQDAMQIVRYGFLVLATLSFVAVLVLCIVATKYSVIGADTISLDFLRVSQSEYVFVALVLAAVVQFPLRLAISVLLALQKSAVATFIPFCSQVLILLYLVASQGIASDDRFLYLTIAYGVSICLPLIAGNIYILIYVRRWSNSSPPQVGLYEIVKTILSGLKFFWIQLSLLAVNGTNEFIILKYYEANDVVQYQLYFRVYSLFLIAISTVTIPLWSAISEAKAEGKFERIVKINKFMKLTILVVFIVMCLISTYLNSIFLFWLGPDVAQTSLYMGLLFAGYTLVMIGLVYAACIANAFDELNGQLIFLSLAIVIKFTILVFYDLTNTAWSHVVLITVISLAPALIYMLYDSGRLLSTLKKVAT